MVGRIDACTSGTPAPVDDVGPTLHGEGVLWTRRIGYRRMRRIQHGPGGRHVDASMKPH